MTINRTFYYRTQNREHFLKRLASGLRFTSGFTRSSPEAKIKTLEEFIMSSRSKKAVPEASQAMEQFKYEVANEIGVPLKQGYNGDLTSAQNGYVGGYMVKKMIEKAESDMAGKSGSKF